MSSKSTTEVKDEESKVEKRARLEAFEFSVSEQGAVEVENASYGHESDEHVYEVSVKHGSADSCECKAYEYQDGPCKHMLAVEGKTAVIVAATPEVEIEPTGTIDNLLPETNEDEENEQERNTSKIVTDGGQELTKLEEGVTVSDSEGVEWTIDTPVEQVATESGYQRRTRLVAENGEIRQEDPREFAKEVNQKTGEFSLLNTTEDDNERRTPRRSEPADFGYGESTGVQDL